MLLFSSNSILRQGDTQTVSRGELPSQGAIVLSLEITLLRTQTWAGQLESGHELGASEPLSSTLRDFIYHGTR